MKSWATPILALLLAILAIFFWFGKDRLQAASPRPKNPYTTSLHGRAALLPLPPVPELPAEKLALGQRLFFEKRLSHDNSLACHDCHDFARGGADRRATAMGIASKLGSVNTPTVFNASLNFAQFWDGRAASLEQQAVGPVHNPLEMASSWEEVISKLSQDKGYRDAFRQIYPHGITGETIADAIATYQQSLLTPDSPFDRFLRGDTSALNTQEQTGYRRFLDYGCASCHQGALLGGNLYQRFGVMGSYFRDRPNNKPTLADLGRFNVTGREEDRYVFKVPGLRNVAVTAPYFHDGSVASLDEAVTIMGRYQLGRELSASDVSDISAFLRSLTGQWEGKPLQ